MEVLVRRGLLVLGLVAVWGVLAAGADARPIWCKTDPVVQIDGQTVHLYLSSYLAMHEAATGPARIEVTVPTGVEAVLRATDPGFGGQGYDVRFAESAALKNAPHHLQIRVRAYAPAGDDSLPVVVDVVPGGNGRLTGGSASGTANEWITLQL